MQINNMIRLQSDRIQRPNRNETVQTREGGRDREREGGRDRETPVDR